jgi:hypothetical protein
VDHDPSAMRACEEKHTIFQSVPGDREPDTTLLRTIHYSVIEKFARIYLNKSMYVLPCPQSVATEVAAAI